MLVTYDCLLEHRCDVSHHQDRRKGVLGYRSKMTITIKPDMTVFARVLRRNNTIINTMHNRCAAVQKYDNQHIQH